MRLLFSILGSLALVACAAEDAPAPSADAMRSAVEPPTAEPGSTTAGAAQSDMRSADPAGARVVFLGTSLTAGYGLADPATQAWPARVAELAAADGAPIEVVNGGVSGDTSAGGLRRLAGLLSAETAAVVIELGANDGLRGLPITALKSNLDAAIDTVRLRAPEATVVVVRMEAPPNLGSDYVDGFAAVFDDLVTRPDVDVTPFLLEGVAGDPRLNQADGIHPLPEGHRMMAQIVWPILSEALGRAAATGAP